MQDTRDCLRHIADAVRKPVPLPVARPACWHDRSWISDTGSSRIPDHMRKNYITHPQAIKNAVSRVFGYLKRYAQPWRNRGK